MVLVHLEGSTLPNAHRVGARAVDSKIALCVKGKDLYRVNVVAHAKATQTSILHAITTTPTRPTRGDFWP